jgi:hypothetical protein
MKTKQDKIRDARKKQTAEVFTPPSLVNDMVDKLPDEIWEEGKTFCDPACGNGNLLIEVLNRKLKKGHKPLEALKTIYGVDIMSDNIRECRMRLLATIKEKEEITEDHVYAVWRNIVWTPLKKYPNGSLDYDFSFGNGIDKRDIQRWMKWIKEGKLEDFVDESITVKETKTDLQREKEDMEMQICG